MTSPTTSRSRGRRSSSRTSEPLGRPTLARSAAAHEVVGDRDVDLVEDEGAEARDVEEEGELHVAVLGDLAAGGVRARRERRGVLGREARRAHEAARVVGEDGRVGQRVGDAPPVAARALGVEHDAEAGVLAQVAHPLGDGDGVLRDDDGGRAACAG